MCEVEVELPVERHPEGRQTEDEEVPGTGGRLLVGHEGDPLCGAAVDVERLPDGELEDTHQGVPHVVHHLSEVTPIQIRDKHGSSQMVPTWVYRVYGMWHIKSRKSSKLFIAEG